MSGVLIIKPVSAKLKHDTETFGKMDPFCKVSVEGFSYETKVHSNGGKFPAWRDVFSYNITNQSLMNVEIWDKDTLSNDLVGECTIPLNAIIEKKKSSEWYTLSYKGKNAGEVLIEAEWRPDNNSTQSFSTGNTMPSVMMGGGMGAQPFNPVYGISYMLPQMHMNQQVQPQYVQQQPMMQNVYSQPAPQVMYTQPMQQPQYVQPMSYQQPQPMMQAQPTYVQPQPTYVQPQPQPTYVQQPQPTYMQQQPQYVQPQPMMQQGYPQQGQQQFSYAPPGY